MNFMKIIPVPVITSLHQICVCGLINIMLFVSDLFSWLMTRNKAKKSSASQPPKSTKKEVVESTPNDISAYFNRTPVITSQSSMSENVSLPENTLPPPSTEQNHSAVLPPPQSSSASFMPPPPPAPAASSLSIPSNLASTPAFPPLQSRFPLGTGAIPRMYPVSIVDQGLPETPIRSTNHPILETSHETLDPDQSTEAHSVQSQRLGPLDQSRINLQDHHRKVIEELQNEIGNPTFQSS